VTTADLATVLILGLAAFRVTRLLVVDSLLEPGRSKFHSMLERHSGWIWAKVYDLVSCTWCVGVYVSFAIYAVYLWDLFVHWTRVDWLSAIAVAGVQGMLHAVEPDES
jgi:amino acid permease